MKKIDYTINNFLVKKYLKKLSEDGTVYLSGGFIRDLLLHKTPNDIDFVFFGEKDGLVKKNKNIKFTKTSFEHDILFFIESRTKIDVKVYPANTTIEDACKTKDYSVNFLFYDGKQIIAPFNSLEDLKDKKIVDPYLDDSRYKEFPNLLPRAFKLLANHGFTFEENTYQLFKRNFQYFESAPFHKIQDIGAEILSSKYLFSHAFPILKDLDVLHYKEHVTVPLSEESNPPKYSNKLFFIYLAWLFNFYDFSVFEEFFQKFNLTPSIIKKAMHFKEVVTSFENNPSSVEAINDIGSLLYYYNSFSTKGQFLDILKSKIKNEN